MPTAAHDRALPDPGPEHPVLRRHHVKVFGRGRQPMLFAHGFGCDQNMWRLITPAFEDDYRIVLFDHIGHGGSDRSQYDRHRYAALDGYAADVLAICEALDLEDVVFVGHSVSAMIGALAAIAQPGRFARMVMIGPSPCYLTVGDYAGGFTREDIDQLLETLDSNFLGWSSTMAPVIMGRPDRPELGEELTNSFCQTDPEVAKQFARVTFLSDNREDLPRLHVPTLVLQCSDDVIAPPQVGDYVHRHLPDSELVLMKASGHCPNLSAPEETIACMRAFL